MNSTETGLSIGDLLVSGSILERTMESGVIGV